MASHFDTAGSSVLWGAVLADVEVQALCAINLTEPLPETALSAGPWTHFSHSLFQEKIAAADSAEPECRGVAFNMVWLDMNKDAMSGQAPTTEEIHAEGNALFGVFTSLLVTLI